MAGGEFTFTPLPGDVLKDYNADKLLGNYFLQLVSIKDISVPPVNQENEFLKVDEEPEEGEEEQNVKGKKTTDKGSQPGKKPQQTTRNKVSRMLCLNLSDGKFIMKAIEYHPIPFLKSDTPIGSRILIKGPVNVSFKVLLLQSHNITVLEGPKTDGKSSKTNNSFQNSFSKSSPAIKTNSSDRCSFESARDSFVSARDSFASPMSVKDENVDPKADKSVIDLCSTIDDDPMYYLDGLDDEILEEF